MKPHLLKISVGPACSFSVRRDNLPFINKWHYHHEVELIYFKEGAGVQFIGDNITAFSSGDVILLGSYLPHHWRFNECYFKNSTMSPDIYVAHFCDNFWGAEFLNIPENQPLKNILEKAKNGLQVNGRAKEVIGNILEKMVASTGSVKVLLLLEALVAIANSDETTMLSSQGFKLNLSQTDSNKIKAIYSYSFANYKHRIQMEEIASIANMSPNSFCKYFKSQTGKTYTNFLMEIRVGIACKLLIENKVIIKEICYESGFNNNTSFHKYFKMITNKTPLSYQKQYVNNKN